MGSAAFSQPPGQGGQGYSYVEVTQHPGEIWITLDVPNESNTGLKRVVGNLQGIEIDSIMAGNQSCTVTIAQQRYQVKGPQAEQVLRSLESRNIVRFIAQTMQQVGGQQQFR